MLIFVSLVRLSANFAKNALDMPNAQNALPDIPFWRMENVSAVLLLFQIVSLVMPEILVPVVLKNTSLKKMELALAVH